MDFDMPSICDNQIWPNEMQSKVLDRITWGPFY